MKKIIFIFILSIFLAGCSSNEPKTTNPDIKGNIYYDYDDYTSPIGGATQYYLGYKFLTDSTLIEFKASYTPALVLLGNTISEEQINITSRDTIKYKIDYPSIYIKFVNGNFINTNYFTITFNDHKFYMNLIDTKKHIDKLIFDNM